MGTFHRTNINDESFIRGAARILYAPVAFAFPTTISDIIVTATGATQYDAVSAASGWSDLGATKTGITISRNNAEEAFDVDQYYADIDSQPTSWEVSVSTALAEATLDRIAFAWEASAPTIDTAKTPDEKTIGIGEPATYTKRRLAVLYQRSGGAIRAYVFRRVQHMPAESSFNHQKTGDQITIPVSFRCLADSTVTDANARFGVVIDQIPGT